MICTTNLLFCFVIASICAFGQQVPQAPMPQVAEISSPQFAILPQGRTASEHTASSSMAATAPLPQQSATGGSAIPTQLSLKDAEGLALKNNPAISVGRLEALASHQVAREARSNLWPQVYGDLTAVDARNNSRITAGSLNNPTIYTRAAGGATASQLISDFGYTTNLASSARLQAMAEEQNAVATKEDVLLAVDRAFYSSLQAHAVLSVAEQTVASRQLLSDQVSH